MKKKMIVCTGVDESLVGKLGKTGKKTAIWVLGEATFRNWTGIETHWLWSKITKLYEQEKDRVHSDEWKLNGKIG